MIQERRGLPSMAQEEIGWELGLIVPHETKSAFRKVRTGPKPRSGYGTQTSKQRFSIERYFERQHLPLCIARVSPSSPEELISQIAAAFALDRDIVLCFDSRLLFGDGDIEHVCLVETFDKDRGQATVIDPAIGAPKRRIISIAEVYRAVQNHGAGRARGVWIISERENDA